MQGWIKLMETYRQTKTPSRTNSKTKINHRNSSTKRINSLTTCNNTNGSRLKSFEPIKSTITINSPPNIFSSTSMINLESTSEHIIQDIPVMEIEPITPPPPPPPPRSTRDSIPLIDIESSTITTALSPSSNGSNRSSLKRSKKTTKSNEISPPITEDISDDDIPLADIRKQKLKSIDTLTIPILTDSIIPLATDLQSLPGHNQDENRDVHFLNYTDIDSLTSHFQTCLYVDQKSSSPTKQYIYKNRTNVLKKIFKIDYYKTFRRNLSLENKSVLFNADDNQNHQPLSIISSPTSTSFKMDWLVNQRNRSSIQRNQPTNIFHILQTNPKNRLNSTNHSSIYSTSSSLSSHSKSHIQAFEQIKDILARTYYPHLYKAIECGYQFGVKSSFPNTHQLITTHDDIISIKQMPESPYFNEDSTTITLKSPPANLRRNSILDQSITPNPKMNSNEESSTDNHVSNDGLSLLLVKNSIVVLTPTRIPSPSPLEEPASPTKSRNHRKRQSSNTTMTNRTERKKKRIVSSPSPEIANHFEEISNSESENNSIPKSNPIKNGLRSHHSKINSKSSRTERRHRQSSSSIPSIYTSLLQLDDEERSSIPNHHSLFQHQKKKSNQPKQKQPLPYKNITRNVYTDQLKQKLLGNYNIENAPICECKPPETCEDGLCLNKISYTECLPTCACGTKCSNQKIRKGHWFKHLEVFDTQKYGQGLRTAAPISKGTFLCEYVGEIITEENFSERMINLYSKDEHHYTMKLTQNLVIDAYRMGSLARFANHSCSPNCEFQKWTVDGLQCMCMFALRNIKPGEELTYDYKFQCFNSQAQQPCYCDNPKCRGTIGTKPNLANHSSSSSSHGHSQQSITMQRMTPRERRTILTSSIFLLRNLRKIKEKYRLRKKNAKLKLTNKQTTPEIFFTQNFYHPNLNNNNSIIASLRKTPKINPRDLFYLFYNHIRRSHFVKTDRYQTELIDSTCYYAQLAQLTLILNEIFSSIYSYKCQQNEIIPSIYLRKCPSKRLFPVYYQMITNPIDLTMMKTKLDHGEYSSFELFEQDLDLLFQNAITYCGMDSNESQLIHELEEYFHQTIKNDYRTKLNLFSNMKFLEENIENLQTFENFVTNFHAKEVREGQIREILYDIIHTIDDDSKKRSPIIYKIVLASNVSSHRSNRSKSSSDCIVHCRCGSVYDENSLVQCYACQLWQHVACVTIMDPTRPHYCFECQPICEQNPLMCLKTNVLISGTLSPLQIYDDNHSSFSILTRSDGFIIRVNECYFVPKQDRKNIDRALTSPEYDILCVERLWIDDDGNGQASGFYYIRPNETFHEPTRKFFPNEVFRFPSSNDSVPIAVFVRSCFVLDLKTYSKGKPISDNSTRVLSSDLFVCEYRVDKTARTFTRFKSKHFGINTKSYCFDNYVEKLAIKRDYQPYQKEIQQQSLHDNRLRILLNSTKLTNKQFKEKIVRLNGCIEKIYCHFHDQNGLIQQPKSTFEQIFGHSLANSPEKIRKKRRTISLSSDDDIVELVDDTDCQNSPKKRSCTQKTISPRKRDDIYA